MNFENIKQKNDFPLEISIGDFRLKLNSINERQKQHNYDLKNAFDAVAAGACDQILIPVRDKVALYIKIDD